MILRISHRPKYIAVGAMIIGIVCLYQAKTQSLTFIPHLLIDIMPFAGVFALTIALLLILLSFSRFVVEPGLLKFTGVFGWKLERDQLGAIEEESNSFGEYTGIHIRTVDDETIWIPKWLCDKTTIERALEVFLS